MFGRLFGKKPTSEVCEPCSECTAEDAANYKIVGTYERGVTVVFLDKNGKPSEPVRVGCVTHEMAVASFNAVPV